jgi:hypothetical protein
MSKRNPKRGKAGRQMGRALARWEGEGGAPKGKRQEAREARTKRAGEEEHILRCLGAAVILQWSDLPRNVQRALFDKAVAMGEPRKRAVLKERIARFLHARHVRSGATMK